MRKIKTTNTYILEIRLLFIIKMLLLLFLLLSKIELCNIIIFFLLVNQNGN
jgi:hypothetical protein